MDLDLLDSQTPFAVGRGSIFRTFLNIPQAFICTVEHPFETASSAEATVVRCPPPPLSLVSTSEQNNGVFLTL